MSVERLFTRVDRVVVFCLGLSWGSIALFLCFGMGVTFGRLRIFWLVRIGVLMLRWRDRCILVKEEAVKRKIRLSKRRVKRRKREIRNRGFRRKIIGLGIKEKICDGSRWFCG